VSVTLRPLLSANELDRLEWRAVGGDQLVAHQQACLVGRQTVEHAADERLAIDVTGEDPDARIGNPAVGKRRFDLAPQAPREDVREVIVAGVRRREVAGMGGMQPRQHAVDHRRSLTVARGRADQCLYLSPIAFQSRRRNSRS